MLSLSDPFLQDCVVGLSPNHVLCWWNVVSVGIACFEMVANMIPREMMGWLLLKVAKGWVLMEIAAISGKAVQGSGGEGVKSGRVGWVEQGGEEGKSCLRS